MSSYYVSKISVMYAVFYDLFQSVSTSMGDAPSD
jgi:hypothetical protein